MAASQVTDELAALELARSRLEVALADDENWRALQQSRGGDDAAEASAERSARNTRLEMALADNPVYQAWKHLNEAIEALHAGDAGASEAAEPLVRPQPSAKAVFGSIVLPEEIAKIIGKDAAEAMPGDGAGTEVAAQAPSTADDVTEQDASADQVATAPQPGIGEPVADADRSSLHDSHGRAPADGDEATVTFVRRAPRRTLLPSAQLPADLGTERKSALFQRLRSVEDPEVPEEAFLVPKGGTEEAQVTIVSSERARTQREAEARAGRLQRFRKTLSGD